MKVIAKSFVSTVCPDFLKLLLFTKKVYRHRIMEEPKNEWPVGKQPDSVATPHHYFSV
jgi:hypothetical protein